MLKVHSSSFVSCILLVSGSWFGLVASETGSAGGVQDHPFGCSRQFLSRNMVASVSLRSVSSVSELTFFSSWRIISRRRSCSALEQVWWRQVWKSLSALRCGLGRYCWPIELVLLLACSPAKNSGLLCLGASQCTRSCYADCWNSLPSCNVWGLAVTAGCRLLGLLVWCLLSH